MQKWNDCQDQEQINKLLCETFTNRENNLFNPSSPDGIVRSHFEFKSLKLIEEWGDANNSCRQYKVKLSQYEHTRLIYRHLLSRNDQQPACKNTAYKNQTLMIKHCLDKCLQWRDTRKKIQSPKQYKNTIGKGFWGGKGIEVSNEG